MIIKSANARIIVTIYVCVISVTLEIIIGCLNQYINFIPQEVFDEFFIYANVMLLLMIILYHKIPYLLLCNMYIYAVISIAIAMVAYNDSDGFINFFKQWDSFTFHYGAQAILSGAEYWYIDTYTRLLALLYSCFGVSYRIGVGVNIEVSLIGTLFLYKLLKLLEIDKKEIIIVTTLFLIMPWKWQLAMFPLREAIPTCLMSISLYFFVKWYINTGYRWVLLSVLFGIFSMMFHSGLIMVPLTYIVVSIMYSPVYKRVVITHRTFRNIFFMIFVLVGFGYALSDSVFNKLPTLDFMLDEAAISEYSSIWINDDGGSTYLTWLSYNSIKDVFIQSPLRALYFALAPVPWGWRGVVDVISFLVGAGVHVYIYGYILKNKNHIANEYKPLLKMLLLMFVLETFIYGATTFNSGTAMRHRAKFEIILFVCWAISMKCKRALRGKMESDGGCA